MPKTRKIVSHTTIPSRMRSDSVFSDLKKYIMLFSIKTAFAILAILSEINSSVGLTLYMKYVNA